MIASQSLIDQIGARIAGELDVAVQQLPHDVSERLRAARTRALANRRMADTVTVTAPVLLAQGSLLVSDLEPFSKLCNLGLAFQHQLFVALSCRELDRANPFV
jgi:hypothetical protein